jgi:phosphate transport system substrate-binding protein
MLRTLCIALLLSSTSLSLHAEELLLRLHGSNTIGANLGPELIKSWLRDSGYTDIRQIPRAPQESRIVAVSPEGRSVRVEIHAHGSSTAFSSLERGEADIGMASRPIKANEVVKMADRGRMNSSASEFVVGLDGIAVIVHPSNPLAQLDRQQLMRIFSGEVTDWRGVGGSAAPIHVYARDDKSGTYDTFKHLILDKQHPLTGTAKRFESNANLSDEVAKDPNGIGFVGLPYIRQSKALAVSDGGAAISPDDFTVATEDYALARRLFLYLPERPHNSVAQQFIHYALSRQGQSVVAQTGFVSQDIVTGTALAGGQSVPDYTALIDGAERLSLNFRFHQGSAHLDNKALQDVQRLVEYLSRQENQQRDLILVGFADSNEVIPMHSLGLSIARADGVADVLINSGVAPKKVRGLGAVANVASNENDQGRQKNRRVEVWIR